MKKIFVKFAVVAVLVAPLAAALPAGAATPNWDITGTWDLSFVANVGAIGTYNHHMDVTQAPDGDFTGTGYYVPAPSFTWVIDPGSTVSGDSVHILLHYTAGHPDTWTTTADATIDGSGTSLSGTWLDSEGDSGTWTGEGTATAVLLSVTTNPATGVTPTSATLKMVPMAHLPQTTLLSGRGQRLVVRLRLQLIPLVNFQVGGVALIL